MGATLVPGTQLERLDNQYEQDYCSLIEFAGRTCFDTREKIGETNQEEFIRRLVNKGHHSVLEHSFAAFDIKFHDPESMIMFLSQLLDIEGLPLSLTPNKDPRDMRFIVSGNFRQYRDLYIQADSSIDPIAYMIASLGAIYTPVFHDIIDEASKISWGKVDKEYEIMGPYYRPEPDWDDKSRLRHNWASFFLVGSRVMSHQIVRHRRHSYSQKSQRFVPENNESYIVPLSISSTDDVRAQSFFTTAIRAAWTAYENIIKRKIKKEDARYILPNACKTQMVMSGPLWAWNHFLDLRTDKHAQREIRGLAHSIEELL